MLDAEVEPRRKARIRITVAVNGACSSHDSVFAAFNSLGLPVKSHRHVRNLVRDNGHAEYEHDRRVYLFSRIDSESPAPLLASRPKPVVQKPAKLSRPVAKPSCPPTEYVYEEDDAAPVETLPNMTFSGGAYHSDLAVARGRIIRQGRARLEALRLARSEGHGWE